MNPTASPGPAGTEGPTTGGDQCVYGLVEWDGTYRPTVVVGCCWAAVLRDIIAIITGWVAAGGRFDSDDFAQQHPIPDPNAPAEVLADWLDALRTEATVPYVTAMEPADLVHTGDPLIVTDWLAANPCYSRPIRRSTTDHRPPADRSPVPTPAGEPAIAAIPHPTPRPTTHTV